jgi:serine acetyltransferase
VRSDRPSDRISAGLPNATAPGGIDYGLWLNLVFFSALFVGSVLYRSARGEIIALRASVGPGFQLYHPTGVVIKPNVVIGARCMVMQNVPLGHDRGGSPRLADM